MLAETERSAFENAGPWGAGTDRGPQGAAWYVPIKMALDFVLGIVLLVATAPLMLAAIVAVKLTSPGPVIYRQVRLGRRGRPFTIYKIRTMIHNCEGRTGPQWARRHDPRVTPVGGFLRRTHLDELPQLWNVLRGEMSLVGPRPERPEFVAGLELALPDYRDRLRVKPGVTGLAQVQLPADTDLESVRRKLAYDLDYVDRAGPRLDLQILATTALGLVGVPYWTSCRILRVPSREFDLEDAPRHVDGAEVLPTMQPA